MEHDRLRVDRVLGFGPQALVFAVDADLHTPVRLELEFVDLKGDAVWHADTGVLDVGQGINQNLMGKKNVHIAVLCLLPSEDGRVQNRDILHFHIEPLFLQQCKLLGRLALRVLHYVSDIRISNLRHCN